MNRLSVAILVLACAGVAHAEEPQRTWLSQRTTAAPATASPSGGARNWRTLAAAGLFLGLGAAVWWTKKHGKKTPLARRRVPVDVIGTTRVGPKAQVVVVRVAGRTALLGVTETSVARLAWLKLEAEREVERVAELPAAEKAPSFGTVLRDALGFKKNPEPALEIAEQTVDVVHARASAEEPEIVMVETQAAGLVARLKELRQ